MMPQDLTQAERDHLPRRTAQFRRPLDRIVSISRVMCLKPNERAPLAVGLKTTSRVLAHDDVLAFDELVELRPFLL